MNNWQPIETAPKDQTWILVWLPLKYCEEGGTVLKTQWYVHWENGKPNPYRQPEWWQHDMCGGFGGYNGPLQPTHWMPLPEPPK
jgi:hypothetical protein